MEIKMLWGQRKELYEGQYFPELLEVQDEYSMEENESYLDEKYKEYFLSNEFSDLQFCTIEISEKAILGIFKPQKFGVAIKSNNK